MLIFIYFGIEFFFSKIQSCNCSGVHTNWVTCVSTLWKCVCTHPLIYETSLSIFLKKKCLYLHFFNFLLCLQMWLLFKNLSFILRVSSNSWKGHCKSHKHAFWFLLVALCFNSIQHGWCQYKTHNLTHERPFSVMVFWMLSLYFLTWCQKMRIESLMPTFWSSHQKNDLDYYYFIIDNFKNISIGYNLVRNELKGTS